jgi:hypothetical protein
MKVRYGSTIIVCFAAVLIGGAGCSDNDSDPIPTAPPNISGQYALVETLTSPDNCFLGNPIPVPIRIAQADAQCVLTTGHIGGPEVCGGISDGIVGSNGVLAADGETVFTDYWSAGCDLIQTENWTLTMTADGQTHGTWSIGYRDDPLNCSAVPVGAFPCVNSYAVAGLLCDDCFSSCPALASGTSRRPGSSWLRP